MYYIPAGLTAPANTDNLLTAPRLTNTREKIVWSPEGTPRYMEMVGPALRSLREKWLDPTSKASMSVVLQMTNHVLTNTASATNKAVSLSAKPDPRPPRTPSVIYSAAKRLRKSHSQWKNAENTDQAKMKECYSADLKSYKRAVRSVRLKDGIKRDDRLLTILSDNPSLSTRELAVAMSWPHFY